jgi:hypothetical protein
MGSSEAGGSIEESGLGMLGLETWLAGGEGY